MAVEAKAVARTDLNYMLKVCYQGLIHYEPSLKDLSPDALCEYAARRLLRDYYIHQPKNLSGDIRFYLENYKAWWEEWRNQGR